MCDLKITCFDFNGEIYGPCDEAMVVNFAVNRVGQLRVAAGDQTDIWLQKRRYKATCAVRQAFPRADWGIGVGMDREACIRCKVQEPEHMA